MIIRRIWSFIYFLLFLTEVQAQYLNLKFESFSTLEGLSSSTCVEIFQDSEGFLWFGTIDGLNKYNGYEFAVYRPEPNNSNSISNNRINAIVEDNNKRLWIGTSNGLNVLNKNTGQFTRVNFNPGDKTTISGSDIINDLLYDYHTNTLWIATREGLSKLDLNIPEPSFESIPLTRYVHRENDPGTLDNNDVLSIHLDQERRIWVGTAGKYLNRYDPKLNKFNRVSIDIPHSYELNHIPKVILLDSEGDFWIGNNLSKLILWERKTNEFKQMSLGIDKDIPVFDIYEDSKGIIWVSTDGYGIYLIDKEKGVIQHLQHSASDPYSLPNNQPSKVLEDNDGIFWVATYNKGVSKLALSKSAFGHYFHKPGDANSLSTRIAQSVIQDSKNRIWIGTDGGGVNLLDEAHNRIRHIRNVPGDPSSISSDKILYLLESYDGNLWVCTWDGGLNKLDLINKKAIRYQYAANDPYSIGQNTVWCAVEDKSHRLWLGTQTAGLNLFDPNTNRFYSFKNVPGDKESLRNNFVFSLFIDSKNRLLAGTLLGLSVVYLDSLEGYIPKHIRFVEPDAKAIQGSRINYTTEDHVGNIWVGTDLGLYKLDGDLRLQKAYSTTEGLPNNLIVGIKEDNDGDLWITTKGGLSRLNPETEVFQNFNEHDGLQGMEFQSKSIYKAKDGRILIGGINGLNVFNPSDIRPVEENLKPMFTGFKLFNKTVRAGDTINNRVVFRNSINLEREIELKYNEGYVTFEYVALHYQNPERVQYAYRMVGLDNDFIFAGAGRAANYSNLAPGDYTFEVKAAIDEDWENAQASAINIKILPPPWKTWWAYLLYIVFIMGGFWVGIYYYTMKVKEDKERELDQMKFRFFINVSHEFRTPLTLILNPLDKILSAYKDPEIVKSSAQTIQRSAQRLLNLINQLLDFRKMDLGKTELEIIKGDIIKFTKDIFMLFEDLAKIKRIKLQFNSPEESLTAWFDPDKVEKIITNLLSNAIKFTDVDGNVEITVSKTATMKKEEWKGVFKGRNSQDYVEIKVRDTGKGFKPEQLNNVFSRFFHVDNTQTGTGIGLNFTKSLVELHGGEIMVESEYGKGSSFIVRLPIEKKYYPSESLKGTEYALGTYSVDFNAIKSTEYEVSISNSSNVEEINARPDEGGKRPVILVVEDNKELRLHLKNELKQDFKIREAINGAEGLEMVSKYYPDVIISDVMMPEMDGFELCRRVKTQIETCHIPVVLLTARSLQEDRIEGYNTGADEYLPKPFNIHVLRARIKNLLEAKNRLRQKFTAIGGVLPSSEITTNSLDEAFLDKATTVVMDNVSDPDFNLEILLKEMGISRSQFYRKINSLTGQNPSNFIRTIRLKHASELLLKNQHSIKEVAYLVGFNSSAYFAKTFGELFGQTPTQFVEQRFQKVD